MGEGAGAGELGGIVPLGARSRAVLLGRRDFHSLPACSCIAELRLEFIGFEHAGAGVMRRFRARFPDAGAERSLDAWRAFEEKNPNTFSGKFQFWLRKPV